jgi:tetratricopeptide (TPR) repeat protein
VLQAALLASTLIALPLAPNGAQGGGLVAAAAATGRPPECSAGSRRAFARGPTLWERARNPSLQRYCDLLALGQAQLSSKPQAAHDAARLADQVLPGHAAPAVLLGRAALALGSPEDAARAFAEARSIDPRSVEDPSTLHDLARALARTGKRDEALAVYRALVPRIDLLGTTDRRVSVLLEAAHASMAAAASALAASAGDPGAGGDKPRARLDETIAYLREARQRPQTQLAGDVVLSLVLTLDRSGDKAQADAALGDATGSSPHPGALEYLAVAEDKLALEALALERSEPATAIRRWEAYLAGSGGKGPWTAAARARLDALRPRSGGAPARKAR